MWYNSTITFKELYPMPKVASSDPVNVQAVEREANGQLKKGQQLSAFPGVTRRHALMMRRLEGMTPHAIGNLERLMTCGNPAAELGATKEILDRTMGKVRQHVDVSVTDTAQAHLAALVELNDRARVRREQLAAGDLAKDVTSSQSEPTIIDAVVIGSTNRVP